MAKRITVTRVCFGLALGNDEPENKIIFQLEMIEGIIFFSWKLPLTKSTSMNSVFSVAFFNVTLVKPLRIFCSTVFSHCCLS